MLLFLSTLLNTSSRSGWLYLLDQEINSSITSLRNSWEMQDDMRNAQQAADAMQSYLQGNQQFDQLQRQLEKIGVAISPYQAAEESKKAWAQLNDLIKERRAMEQRQQQDAQQQQKQDIWQKLLERSIQLENGQKASKQQAQTPEHKPALHERNIWEILQERKAQIENEQRKAEEKPPERRLGQPRELSLEEQTRLLIESGNTSIAKFGLEDAARKQYMQDLQHVLLERARQLERQTPLKETLDALRGQTPLHETLRALHHPEKPAAHQSSSAFDTMSERLAQLQAENRLAARNEAEAREQRQKAMERLNERFAEQLKQHYEPVPQHLKPDIWKAMQERQAQLKAQQHTPHPKVWDSLSERLSQLRAAQRTWPEADHQQEEQRQQAMKRLQERFNEQLKQTYEEVQPTQYIGAEAYQKRIAKQEAARAERQAAEHQRSESPLWKTLQERSAELTERAHKMAARQQQEAAERHQATKRQEQPSPPEPAKMDMDALTKQLLQPSHAQKADAFQERKAREGALRAERQADFEQDWHEKVKYRRQEHRHHERERRHERQHDFGPDQY